jgi:5'-3' exoribonuclease 2
LGSLDIQFELGTPFAPFSQLMGVLPAASAHALPAAYGPLMTEPSSPIVDFYPTDFDSDLNGKRFAWQAVTLLPWIDEARLLAAIGTVEGTLTDEEKHRNSSRLETLFLRATHPLGGAILKLEEAQADLDAAARAERDAPMDAALSGGMNGQLVLLGGPACPPSMPSPVEGMPPIARNAVVGVAFKLPPPRFVAPRLPEGAMLPEPVVQPGDIAPPPTLWHEEQPQRHGGGGRGGAGYGGYGGPNGYGGGGRGNQQHGGPMGYYGGGSQQHGGGGYPGAVPYGMPMYPQQQQQGGYPQQQQQQAYAQYQQQQQPGGGGGPGLASAAHRLLQRSMQFAGAPPPGAPPGGLNAGAPPFAPLGGGAVYAQQGYMQAQPAFGALPQQQQGAYGMHAQYGVAGGYAYGGGAAPQQAQQAQAQAMYMMQQQQAAAAQYGGGYAQQQAPAQQQQQQQQPGGDNRFGALGNLPRRDPRAGR